MVSCHGNRVRHGRNLNSKFYGSRLRGFRVTGLPSPKCHFLYLMFIAFTTVSALPCCTVIAISIGRAHKFRQFSLIFCDILSLFNYVIKLMIILIIGHFSTLHNSAKLSQFHEKTLVPPLGSKFCSPRKTVGPSHEYSTNSDAIWLLHFWGSETRCVL